MGKFVDQTLHVAERVRVAHPWKLFDTPLRRRSPRLKTTCLAWCTRE